MLGATPGDIYSFFPKNEEDQRNQQTQFLVYAAFQITQGCCYQN